MLSAHILSVDAGAATAQFQRMCQQVASVHELFGELDDALGKFILLRSCAGVCKVT